MEIRIRQLGRNELELVRKVADEVWPVTFRPILSEEQVRYMMEMMYSQAVMEREFDGGISFYGVFDADACIGYISLGPCPSSEGAAKLHKCYLLTGYHGKGIGSMMLAKAKEIAKGAGYARLRLNVNRQNARAIKAYVRNGFTTVETVDKPIGNGFFMNDYVMEASL